MQGARLQRSAEVCDIGVERCEVEFEPIDSRLPDSSVEEQEPVLEDEDRTPVPR